MATLQGYLDRGWRFIGARSKSSAGVCRVKCPNASCGLVLGVQGSTDAPPKAVEIGQLVELSVALANRRYSLGLTADDIDDCAGLGNRHLQKVEDAGRNMGEGRTISSDVVLALLQRVLEEGLTEDSALRMSSMVATRAGLEGKRPARPRVPTVDTLLLIVQALGGRLLIDWGEPPRMTRRLMGNSDG